MVRAVISGLLAGFLISLLATPPSIGIVRSDGDFRVDGSSIRGNMTLLDGAIVETTAVRSVVQLATLDMALLPDSRAKIYRDHSVLEKGSGLVMGSQRHALEVDSLRITSTGKDSEWQVELTGPNRVEVTDRKGGAEVRNQAGLLLAVLQPGMLEAFLPQAAGGDTATKLTGRVEMQNGMYYLVTTTNVKVELRGDNLARLVGKQVQIVGSIVPNSTPTNGATQVVQVTEGKILGGGISTTTKVLIVGGAAGGALGAAAAGGAFGGHSNNNVSNP